MIRYQRVKRLANWKLETCIPQQKYDSKMELNLGPHNPAHGKATYYSMQVSCHKEKENSFFPYRHYR